MSGEWVAAMVASVVAFLAGVFIIGQFWKYLPDLKPVQSTGDAILGTVPLAQQLAGAVMILGLLAGFVIWRLPL